MDLLGPDTASRLKSKPIFSLSSACTTKLIARNSPYAMSRCLEIMAQIKARNGTISLLVDLLSFHGLNNDRSMVNGSAS